MGAVSGVFLAVRSSFYVGRAGQRRATKGRETQKNYNTVDTR